MSGTIEDVKDVYVAWSNTDLTEGRGYAVVAAVAESYEAAVRLGRKGSVMGSDCEVTKEKGFKIGGQWLIPGLIHKETKEDTALRVKREARESAMAKAKAAGMSDADIAALTGK